MTNEDPAFKNILGNIYPRTQRRPPAYLVSFRTKTENYVKFIATKYEEGLACANLIGFFTNDELDKIRPNIEDILTKTDKNNYLEVKVPWSNVQAIVGLNYRHK